MLELLLRHQVELRRRAGVRAPFLLFAAVLRRRRRLLGVGTRFQAAKEAAATAAAAAAAAAGSPLVSAAPALAAMQERICLHAILDECNP